MAGMRVDLRVEMKVVKLARTMAARRVESKVAMLVPHSVVKMAEKKADSMAVKMAERKVARMVVKMVTRTVERMVGYWAVYLAEK